MILDRSELDCPLSGAKRFKGFVQMARKQLAEQWAEHRRQRDEEERRQRVMVITEFDAGDPKRPCTPAQTAMSWAQACKREEFCEEPESARSPAASCMPRPRRGLRRRSDRTRSHHTGVGVSYLGVTDV